MKKNAQIYLVDIHLRFQLSKIRPPDEILFQDNMFELVTAILTN